MNIEELSGLSGESLFNFVADNGKIKPIAILKKIKIETQKNNEVKEIE